MLLMIVAALAAFQDFESPESRNLREPNAAEFSAAREFFDERLLDYPSARFRDVRGDGRRLCGYVNAKNRMGAYTGWVRFLVLHTDPASGWVDDDEMTEVLCTPEFMERPEDYSDRLRHR